MIVGMDTDSIDPTEVHRAARDLFLQYGVSAEMEAQERILKADAEGSDRDVAFWQNVSRALQAPYATFY
jgi:hypothetical protein